MAIAQRISPTMVLHGTVIRVTNRSGEGKNGPWAIRTLELEQPSGARTTVSVFADDGVYEFGNPSVGDFFVANVFVQESGREPELRFHSWPFDVLDLIQSSLAARA